MKPFLFSLTFLLLACGQLRAATETDACLHADGKGWRLDKAKVTDSQRPRVLLIGDSILNGFGKQVVAALSGKAYVDSWVNPYHQSEHLNKLLAEVLANGPYDVVHFNMGLHGWPEGRIKPGTFDPLTRAYVEVLKTTLPRAKLIWASSTPVTARDKPGELEPDINPVIIEHNRMAAKVMAEMNVPVNDFYGLLVNKRELARGDRFHWTAPAYKILADQATRSIVQALATEKRTGFTDLSDGNRFAGWTHGGNWVIEDGAFYRKEKGGSLTYTNATVPDDFELRFEWKVSKGCNSGVYYRPGQVEYQVLDNANSPYGENARQAAASIFFCMAPKKDATRTFGEWNTGRVICKGTVIEHWLNGERVISFDYTDPKWAEYVKLLGIRGGDLTGRGGKLWLQDHGQDVWFRKLRWREIPTTEMLAPDPTFKPMPVTGAALEKEQARVRGMLESAKKKAAPTIRRE